MAGVDCSFWRGRPNRSTGGVLSTLTLGSPETDSRARTGPAEADWTLRLSEPREGPGPSPIVLVEE